LIPEKMVRDRNLNHNASCGPEGPLGALTVIEP
jgi:hypothetical protein